MSESNIVSNADNFSEHISSGVDVRTGMHSINVNLGHFISHKGSGSIISLQLSYDASNARDIGFGRGWNIPLSYFNKISNSLSLSTGQSFNLVWNSDKNEYDIPYRRLNDIRVLYLDDTSEINVVYKDGRNDYLDWEMGLLKRMASPSGLEIYFEYGTFNFQQVLCRIYDNAGRELTIDWWSNDWKTIVEHSLDGKVCQTIVFEKSGNGKFKRLSDIAFPELTTSTSIQYRYIKESGYDVIERVTHASGLIEQMTYSDKGHLLPKNAPLLHVPYISEHTLNPGEGQPLQYTAYEYSDKNYLGFASDRAWVAGEDTLFKAEGNYKYTTTETINNRIISREYNKYHLLECAKYYDGSNLYKVERYTYFANLNAGIDSQPTTYSLVKEQTTTHYYQGKSRNFTKQYDYDDFGNQILECEVDGSQIIRSFYPASGEGASCPASPNGMVSLVKEEIFVPDITSHTESARTTIMTYKSFPTLNNVQNYFVVLSTLNIEKYSEAYDYFEDLTDPYRYGQIRTETITINQHNKTVNYNYAFATDGLKTTTTLQTYDGIEITESKTVDYFFGLPIEVIDKDGVVSQITYDSLGRKKYVLIAPDTEYSATKSFDYVVGDGINAITETDTKENIFVTHMNNAGKVIRVQQTNNDRVFLTVRECVYDEFGLMIKQTDTDWLDGSPLHISTQFTYDVNAEVKTITHQDDRQETIEQDPVLLITTYCQVGLILEITTYNVLGQEISKESKDWSSNLLAKTDYSYDGYGNLRYITDTNGYVVEHKYDLFDRVYETERHIDGERVIESFSYPEFSDSDAPSRISVNNIEIGSRNYDGLLRIKNETAAGSVKSYSYTGSASDPNSITMPNGAVLDISNNTYLRTPELISIAGQPQLTSVYRYDQESAHPLYSLNQGCERNATRDSYGRILTETIKLNDGVLRRTNYRYSLHGKILETTDFFGNTITFGYDQLGRLYTTTEDTKSVQTNTVIEYDKYSRPRKYTTQNGGDEAVVELNYNPIGLETSRVAKFNGNEEFSITQHYNASLLLETRIFEDAGGQTAEIFTYDDLYRLMTFTCNGPNQPEDGFGNTIIQQDFSHDIYGNITQVISQFSDLSSNTGVFRYESNNPVRLEAVTNTHHSDYPPEVLFQYDGAGNLLNDEQGRVYHYNDLNQMVSVEEMPGEELSRYQYDAGGRIVSQTIEENLLYLFYCNGEVSNELVDGAHSSYQRVATGLTGRTVSNGVSKQHQIILGNSQGSVIETLSIFNDETKRSKDSRRYTPYGEG
jgi:YD repeat-containing protein